MFSHPDGTNHSGAGKLAIHRQPLKLNEFLDCRSRLVQTPALITPSLSWTGMIPKSTTTSLPERAQKTMNTKVELHIYWYRVWGFAISLYHSVSDACQFYMDAGKCGEAKEREGERFTRQLFLPPSLPLPAILLEHYTKAAPAHLHTILIKLYLCKANCQAKKYAHIQEIE